MAGEDARSPQTVGGVAPSPPRLSGAQRRRLRGLAHGLDPLARVGRGGLSTSVLAEIRSALDHHELVKVRFLGGREDLAAGRDELATQLGAHVVGSIGHIAILFRQHPDPERRRVPLAGGA